MVLESSGILNCLEVVIAGLCFFFSPSFFLVLFLKNRQPKRSLPTSLFLFSFAFSRIVLSSLHSSIDLGGEEAAQRESDK